MSRTYLRLKDNPNVARIVDETGFVHATVGKQPKTFNEQDWESEGEASFAKAQQEVNEVFLDAKKPDNKKESKDRSKKLYDALIKSGTEKEFAVQISGYKG